MSEMEDDDRLRQILEATRTIAVVGLSTHPGKDSHQVSAYLKARGFRVIPIHPAAVEVLGETAYPDLLALPMRVDMVLAFRPSAELRGIADQAVRIGARTLWSQLGLADDEAGARARAAGLQVVMDRCIRTEHRRLHRA